MSPLVKLILLSLLVQLVVGYYKVPAGGCTGGRCGRRKANLVRFCNNQPRRPICERLGLGPVYGQGGQDGPEYEGPGPEVDENDPGQVEYQEPEGPGYAKH